MEDLKASAGQLKDNAQAYFKTYVDLAKVKATKAASNSAAGAVVGILTALFCIFILLFVALGLSWWLGNLVDNRAAGFFMTAGIFLVLLLLLFALKQKAIAPMIRNMVIRKIYE